MDKKTQSQTTEGFNLMVAWDTYRRFAAMLLIVASCSLVSSLFRVYAKLKHKKARRQTADV